MRSWTDLRGVLCVVSRSSSESLPEPPQHCRPARFGLLSDMADTGGNMDHASVLVLVVDDEEMVRENLEAYLEDEGFNVVTASSGEDALNLLAEVSPHVGIIDMRLPGMSGNDFILKAHTLRPALRYLIHTGSTNYKLPPELIAIGVTRDDIYTKPLQNMDDLVKGIGRHMGSLVGG